MSNKSEKLKAKRDKKLSQIRSSRRKRTTIVVLAVILIGAVFGFLYNSNFFNVRQIKIEKNKNISDEAVIEKSGIRRGESLFTLKLEKIESRLRKHNWIEDVKVVKSWPDSVVVKVYERKPVFFLETDESIYLLDEKSFVIDKINGSNAGSELPKIDGLSLKQVKIGQSLKSDSLKNAIKAHEGLDKKLKKKIFSITAKSIDELYFVIDGIEIVYGEAKKVELKNKVINTIMNQKKESISTIDVRVPEKPVTRVLGK